MLKSEHIKKIRAILLNPVQFTVYNTSLTRKLDFGYFVLLSLSIFLSSLFLYDVGKDYVHAREILDQTTIYKKILIVANRISAERGPTNTLLGGDYEATSPSKQKLVDFRKNTDLAIDDLNNALPPSERQLTQSIKNALSGAREEVDFELRRPFQERSVASISRPIRRMFSAVDVTRAIMTKYALNYSSMQNSSDKALVAKALFEIRDYAGRLGSILTPYIAKNARITNDDMYLIKKYTGRIDQLWDIIEPQTDQSPTFDKTKADIKNIFFQKGLSFINLLEEQSVTGEYRFTTKTMTDELVPTFLPLETMRELYLNYIINNAEQELSSSKRWFLMSLVMAIIMVAINIALMIETKKQIFIPLLVARDNIVSLSEDESLPKGKKTLGMAKEIDEVFSALHILDLKLIEKRTLAKKLKENAETDQLTGLLNRRGIENAINAEYPFSGFDQGIGLIISDIDLFKSINDTYGHDCGDRAIVLVANVIKSQVRKEDMVARYGGEEFIIVTPKIDEEDLFAIAEKIRQAIATAPLEVGEDRIISVKASFGIATGSGSKNEWHEIFRRADSALYTAKRNGRNMTCSAKGCLTVANNHDDHC